MVYNERMTETGVEKHAQAILAWADDWFSDDEDAQPVRELVEAVLVAARDHNTRLAAAAAEVQKIIDRHALENAGSDSHLCSWCDIADFPCHDREDAEAALRLLRGGEA